MKWKCQECGAFCTDDGLLVAENPFNRTDEIVGCPACLQVECLLLACDEGGCNKLASMGTPTSEGYRNTCFDHGICLAKTKDSD